ncbi:ADP-ribose pyrophosphatase [Paenibacillus montaniterrae]|uniref:ADP-ribose pyrophosphatase n=1 Tax=Paenibacillus montaniterrae TaxID=429341 RepID=A0A920CSW4_9BACL|nr:NUDIX hydrolase [Paenibacillus montaniterrae]GIP15217.1 ADP-ribose pyrophosphatase [Paenibacillus montaniterrae]
MEKRSEKIWHEPTLATEHIFKGKIIELQVDTIELPDGRTATREIVRHPGAAAVIALHEGKLIVVEQYRKPLGKTQIEIPAGKLDPNEEPQLAAVRELAEETGYVAHFVQLLQKFYTSPGFADELLYVYFTDQVTAGEQHLDEDEDVIVRLITLEEADRYIASGQISDAKTLLAVYAWKLLQATGKLQ